MFFKFHIIFTKKSPWVSVRYSKYVDPENYTPKTVYKNQIRIYKSLWDFLKSYTFMRVVRFQSISNVYNTMVKWPCNINFEQKQPVNVRAIATITRKYIILSTISRRTPNSICSNITTVYIFCTRDNQKYIFLSATAV